MYEKIVLNQFSTMLLSIVLVCGISVNGLSQSDCQVKVKELSGSYDGDCKKGLAHGEGTAKGTDQYKGEFRKGLPHGKGIYTWSDGMSYDGEFKNGEKQGEGKMTITVINQKDSVLVGFWDKDTYVGKHKDPYKVHDKSSLVTGTRVTKAEGDDSIIYITINLKGKNESNANFELQEQVGSYSSIQPFGRVTKVHVVRFPFRFVLSYLGETAEIEIFNEGAWNVLIDINK
jgi:hypothetical protein